MSVEQTFLNTIHLHPQGSGIRRRRKERNTKTSIYCKMSFYTSVFLGTLGLHLLPPGNKAKFKRMKTLCLISRSLWDISGTAVLPWFKKAWYSVEIWVQAEVVGLISFSKFCRRICVGFGPSLPFFPLPPADA